MLNASPIGFHYHPYKDSSFYIYSYVNYAFTTPLNLDLCVVTQAPIFFTSII